MHSYLKRACSQIGHLKNNWTQYLILIGIFLIPFSKTFIVVEPNFYLGKFNILQTTYLSIAEVWLLMSLPLFYIYKYCKHKKNESVFLVKPNIVWIACLSLFYINNPNVIHIIIAVLLSYACSLIPTRLIYKTFSSTSLLQAGIVIFQLIAQKNTGISILSLLGEPSIDTSVKGIAKLRYQTFELIRPYGTTPHPNIAGALISSSLLFDEYKQTTKSFITKTVGFISTLSLSAIFASSCCKLKFKPQTFLLIIILLFTMILRLSDIGFESLSTRVNQIQEYSNQFSSTQDILFGNQQQFVNTSTKLPWEIYPIHNTYLYALNSYGIVGFLILVYLIRIILLNNKQLGIFLIVIFMFDHFWLTNPTGILLLSLLFSLSIQKNQDYHG